MIKLSVLTIFYFSIAFGSNAQTGFYLVMENGGTYCAREVEDFDGKKKYCVPENPIVNRADFEVVGYLQYSPDLKEQFFYIRFNQSGYETLRMIHAGMPKSKLALVVKGKALGIYDGKTFDPTKTMYISGKSNSKEINWMFDNIKKE
jgi:hypothetical protein